MDCPRCGSEMEEKEDKYYCKRCNISIARDGDKDLPEAEECEVDDDEECCEEIECEESGDCCDDSEECCDDSDECCDEDGSADESKD